MPFWSSRGSKGPLLPREVSSDPSLSVPLISTGNSNLSSDGELDPQLSQILSSGSKTAQQLEEYAKLHGWEELNAAMETVRSKHGGTSATNEDFEVAVQAILQDWFSERIQSAQQSREVILPMRDDRNTSVQASARLTRSPEQSSSSGSRLRDPQGGGGKGEANTYYSDEDGDPEALGPQPQPYTVL